jgi:hypothetical protein
MLDPAALFFQKKTPMIESQDLVRLEEKKVSDFFSFPSIQASLPKHNQEQWAVVRNEWSEGQLNAKDSVNHTIKSEVKGDECSGSIRRNICQAHGRKMPNAG